jgi:hypothetical protein
VVTLSSQAMAQPSANQNATSNAAGQKATGQMGLTCLLESKNPKAPFDKQSFAVVGLVAGLILLAVTFATSRIIRKGREWLLAQGQLVLEANCKQGNHKGGFWDIIREGDYYPSLARLQFVLWTFTISFTLLSIYLLANNLRYVSFCSHKVEGILVKARIKLLIPKSGSWAEIRALAFSLVGSVRMISITFSIVSISC